MVQAFPPGSPTTIQNMIPSYLYVQYQDDDALQAFVQAYNIYAQAYLTYLNNLNLPIYTSGLIAGSLLDWVALGIYGFMRPVFANAGVAPRGPLNTWQYNSLTYNTFIPGIPSTYTSTDDDIFKRVLTWHLYKGDGKVFNVTWFKRRILRFLYGVNGTNPSFNPYGVSIALTGPFSVTVIVPGTPVGILFAQGIRQGVLETPFQLNVTVNTSPIPADALLDSDGNPVLDSNGNFVLTS
jgi:hypothetical protein